MFKKLFSDVKSAVGDLWDEVNDEAKLDGAATYLTIADTAVRYFVVNEEIKITFTDEAIIFESTDEERANLECPCSAIREAYFCDTPVRYNPFRGSYISFDSGNKVDFFYFKASTIEPHYFLECVQKLKIVEELNDKRYARTAKPLKQVCEGCGAVIHEANCSHCGMMNTMGEVSISESDFEYEIDPKYTATLELQNSSLDNLFGGEKVFYHIYEDCVTLRIRGTGNSYIPKNVIILFENILSFSLKQYGSTESETGLHITYKDNGTQFVQFKIHAHHPNGPFLNLEYIKGDFNIKDIYDAVDSEHDIANKLCEYCGMPISGTVCPYCMGVN